MNSLIYLLAALCAFGFAFRIHRHKKRLVAARSYMLLCGITCIAFFSFAAHLVSGEIWLRLFFYSSASFVSPCLLLFLHKWNRKEQNSYWMWYTNASLVVVYVIIELLFRTQTNERSFGEGFVSLCFFGGLLYCGRYLWLSMKQEKDNPIKTERLRHLLILFGLTIIALGIEGMIRAFVVYEGTVPLTFQMRNESLQGLAPPFSAPLSVLFLYVLYLNITLTRLVDVYELFARLSATAVSAIFLTALITLTLYLGSNSSLHVLFHLILVLILFLSLYPFLQKPIQQISTQFFNRPGKQLYTALKMIESSLPDLISIDKLDPLLLTRLHETGRCATTSLYLWDHEQGLFVLQNHYGSSTELPIQQVGRTPFSEHFEVGRVLEEEELTQPEDNASLVLMQSMHAKMCFPLWSERIVVGWIALSPSPWSDGFSREELRALRRIVSQIERSLDTIRSIDKLKEQHRLAALGTMSAGLAHEIRNPLAGIKGAAQFLQEQNQQEEQQEFLALIVSETDRLNQVVSQFLSYARPMQLHKEEGEINELLHSVVELEKANPQNQKITYELVVARTSKNLSFDSNLMYQVLLNLLQNAAQAMHFEGIITIRSKLGSYLYAPHQGQPSVEITVSDTGEGISKEEQKKLFIPFFTTKENGTGLGLAISQRLIEAHNGHISVQSRKGKGTTFTISLPILLQD